MILASTQKTNSPYARVGADLVDMGYHAIPVMPGSKRPGNMSGGSWYGDLDWSRFCDRRPTDIETGHWSRWPDAGVCIAIDKTLKVIDVDTDDPELRAAIESVLPTPLVKKRGQKGYSAFYRGSDAIVSRPFNLVFPGGFKARVVDLLAHGRQTVLPPTVHPDTGKPYEWTTDDTLLDTPIEKLPELPDDIATRIAAALEPFGSVPDPVRREHTPGDENSVWRALNDAALTNFDAWVPALFNANDLKRNRDGSYRARAFWRDGENFNVGIHPSGIKDWVEDESFTAIDLVMRAAGIPAFEQAYAWLAERVGFGAADDSWVDKYADSVRRLVERAPHKAATATSAAETLAVPVRAPRAKPGDPFTPEAAGGLVGAIAQWSLETARRPVPEFAVMAATIFVATLFGRQAVGPTGAGLNLYMVGVAGPGFGKEHAHKTLQTIAMDAGQHTLIGPGEVTSGSAIEKVVRKRPVFVMPWDEMGVVLQSVTGAGSSSWAKTIRKVLLEIFSKSTSVWSGKEHADPTRDSSAEPVHCPTVSLLGMSTPTTFYKGLTEETLSDGFIARLIVIEARDRPDRQAAPPLMVATPSLVAKVKEWQAALPLDNNLKVNWRNPSLRPTLYTVPWADEGAERQWLAIEDWQIEQIEEHGAHDGLVGRTAEHVIKLATVRSLSRDPKRPAVTVADIDWAYAIVQRSIDTLEVGAKEHMAGSQFEELCKAIMRAVKRAKGGELAYSKLVVASGVSKADDRMVKAAIDRLHAAGDIDKPSTSGRGMKIRLANQAADDEAA